MLLLGQYFERDYHGVTTLHPLGLVAVLVLGGAMLFVPRRFAIWPMIVMACFIASAQRLVIAGADFNLLRLMVLFGVVRVVMRGEYAGFRWKAMDFALVAWLISGTIAYTTYYGTPQALLNRMGWMYDGLGMYFVFRCLIRGWRDVDRTAMGFIIASVPVAFAFVVEYITQRNAFAIFGGVPEVTWIRDGKLRCQGAFAHPILAGTFWATLMPLMAARWWRGGPGRYAAVIGVGCALMIVYACASSGAVLSVLTGAFGGAMFVFRRYMGTICLGVFVLLIGLHLTMQAPVWHLISRVDVIGGSTGWHRYHLIDQTINNFDEWWLFGTHSTAHWGHGLYDITNQYVLEGVRGGFVTLMLFVTMIVLGFLAVGSIWRRAAVDTYTTALGWALGVSLFVHVVSFTGVSYFGQIIMIWFLLLAMICSMKPAPGTMPVLARQPRKAPPRPRVRTSEAFNIPS